MRQNLEAARQAERVPFARVMFEQSLQIIAQLSASDRNPLIARLAKVRTISHNFGYGVGDDMDSLLAKYMRK